MLVVGTCPECLPAGSITWLIENGRQLELFRDEGVLPFTRGGESRLPELDISGEDLPF